VKGLVIANCGAMGLDWERLSMSGYLEAIAARGGEYEGAGEPGEPHDRERLLRFHRARSGEA
jgi:hypothetical protein